MLLKLILRQSSIKKKIRTTREKCLIWFQYKLLYNLRPTGRYLFQRQLVDSPVCAFCKDAEETLLHTFWDCPKIQDYWFDVQGWLHTSFTHCTNIIFSKELVILGSKANVCVPSHRPAYPRHTCNRLLYMSVCPATDPHTTDQYT